jgi:lysophospholipase L1-like esterase
MGLDLAFGTTVPNTSTAGASYAYGNDFPVTREGELASVSARLSAPATGEIHVVAADGEVLAAFPVTGVAGLNTWSAFGGYTLPVGADIFYYPLTGGHVRYVSGGSCRYYATTDYSAVGDVVALQATTATLALSYVVSVPGETVFNEIDRAVQIAGAAAGEDTDGITVRTIGDTAPDDATLVAGHAPCVLVDLDRPAIAKSLQVRMAAAATGFVYVYRHLDGFHYRVVAKYPVSLAGGLNTITDVAGKVLKRGDMVVYASTSGGNVRYSTTGGGVWRSILNGGNPAVGDVRKVSYWSSPLAVVAMQLEYETLADEPPAEPADNGMVNGPLHITSERFSSTPAQWQLGGAFSISSGLRSQGTGAWDNVAVLDDYSSLFRKRITMRVRINDDASIFGLCTQPITGTTNGSVAMVDCAAGKLRIYFWDGTSTAGTLGPEVALPPIVEGREYALSVIKDGLSAAVTFTDTETLAAAAITDTWAGGARRHWHGRPGVMHLAGDVTTKWFDVHAGNPGYVRALILGDSNTEGTASNSTHPSWAAQLATDRNDIVVAARAGDSSTHLLARASTDLLRFRPEFLVIMIGTNDSSQTTWRANVAALIRMAQHVGAEPILSTLIPKDGGQGLITLMNADIRAGYFGTVRYIDAARAVSDSNDGVTWNVAYKADGAHMNTAGQTKALEQALVDAPFLAA